MLIELKNHVRSFGYHVTKCHLITKPQHLNTDTETFRDGNVDIESGYRVLGSVIASDGSQQQFSANQVNQHAKFFGNQLNMPRFLPSMFTKAWQVVPNKN